MLRIFEAPKKVFKHCRRGILDALYDLLDDSGVKHGDTFIIYYSGHGTSYAARDYWEDTRGTIEAITPVDCGGESGYLT